MFQRRFHRRLGAEKNGCLWCSERRVFSAHKRECMSSLRQRKGRIQVCKRTRVATMGFLEIRNERSPFRHAIAPTFDIIFRVRWNQWISTRNIPILFSNLEKLQIQNLKFYLEFSFFFKKLTLNTISSF